MSERSALSQAALDSKTRAELEALLLHADKIIREKEEGAQVRS